MLVMFQDLPVFVRWFTLSIIQWSGRVAKNRKSLGTLITRHDM